MNTVKHPVKVLFSRGAMIFIVVLFAATVAPQILSKRPVFAIDGYPFTDAHALYTSPDYTSSYGYATTCPSKDTQCMSGGPLLIGSVGGVTYGEADPWLYGLRNCTSYAAWKINQVFGVSNITGWGNAYQWDTGYTTAQPYAVYAASGHTPQVGEIAQWEQHTGDSMGHVAYVWKVESNGTADLWEYNQAYDGNFVGTRSTASGSDGTPDHYIHIAPMSPFVIRTGTDVQVKPWLGGSWSTINSNQATDTRIAATPNDNRITYTDTSGAIWAEDNLSGSWSNEYTNPSQYAISPYLFVKRTGTDVTGKAGLSDGWTALNGTTAADIRVNPDGGLITYTAVNGHVWAKEWLGGTWYDEYTSPDQYAASDQLFVIRLGTNVYAKAVLSDPWTLINGTSATDIRVYDNRITYTDTNGHVWAKDGLYGTWYDMYTSPTQYAASGSLFVIRNGTDIKAKANLSDTNWTVVLNNTWAVDMRLYGNRITYTDVNGHDLARDSLGSGWYDEYTNPSQYTAGNTW